MFLSLFEPLPMPVSLPFAFAVEETVHSLLLEPRLDIRISFLPTEWRR